VKRALVTASASEACGEAGRAVLERLDCHGDTFAPVLELPQRLPR
jgi:hypothetical protein